MSQLVRVMLAGLLTGLTLAGPASAAPATAVLGDSSVGGNCTESDLDTALAVGGTITFNCGGPKAISITAVKTITQATILNGADAITLSGGFSTRLFVVNSGATLRLEHLVLDSAVSAGSDGGAIVNHGALVLDHSTIQHSRTDSAHSGGAIFKRRAGDHHGQHPGEQQRWQRRGAVCQLRPGRRDGQRQHLQR